MTARSLWPVPHGALAQLGAQVFFEGEDLRCQGAAAQLLEARITGVSLGVPLVGEAPARDVVHQLAHRGSHIEVVEAPHPRQLPVLARG